MNSIAIAKNKEPSANDVGHQYNWQHFVLVTKYRYKMFGKQKTRDTVKDAIYDVASRKKMDVMEFAFGEDFAHIHILLNLPPTLTVSQAAQLLKGYSAYVVFREIPNHRLRYPQGHFWSAGYGSSSVGPQNVETIRNYIRKQDISDQAKPSAA